MDWHRDIASDEFFYVEEDNYDEHIELAIPFYQEMHRAMVRLVPDSGHPLHILDLGTGTGKTALAFLKAFPSSKIRAIELFDSMLRHARERLTLYETRVELVMGDFMTEPFGEELDLCVSSLAVHHQTANGKQRLFSRIASALKPKGVFLLLDWTKFDCERLNATASLIAEEHCLKSVNDQAIVEAWRTHWKEKNIPDTVDHLREWMHQAGFEYTECVMRFFGISLIYARKA